MATSGVEAGTEAPEADGDGRRSRRRVLVGLGATAVVAAGGGGLLVERGVLPGRNRLRAVLGLDGVDGVVPDVDPGPFVDGSFDSERAGASVGWAVSYPPGVEPDSRLPVLVSLHGRGGSHETSFGELGLDRFLADAVAKGVEPFAVASVDGGDSYWHRRRDGTDRGAMVLDEFLPLLADRGLLVDRPALFGWSMGGYGALLLASELGADRVAAVATSSAALWTPGSDTAPGAFDDEGDAADHDVFARRVVLADIPLRMDCGDGDPFAAANRAFRDALDPVPAGGFVPGAHTAGYWRRMLPAQLRFVARHLAAGS